VKEKETTDTIMEITTEGAGQETRRRGEELCRWIQVIFITDSGEMVRSMVGGDTLLPTKTSTRVNLLMEIDLAKVNMHGLMVVSMREIGSVIK